MDEPFLPDSSHFDMASPNTIKISYVRNMRKLKVMHQQKAKEREKSQKYM